LTNREILKEQLPGTVSSKNQKLDLLDFTLLDNENSYLSAHDFNNKQE